MEKPTFLPRGWRNLLPNEKVEYGDWFWVNGRYLPVLQGSNSADENSCYIRKKTYIMTRGKW